MPLRQTHTFAVLDLSKEAFAEIRHKLKQAGYEHAFIEQDGRLVIDMHGIAVAQDEDEAGLRNSLLLASVKAAAQKVDSALRELRLDSSVVLTGHGYYAAELVQAKSGLSADDFERAVNYMEDGRAVYKSTDSVNDVYYLAAVPKDDARS